MNVSLTCTADDLDSDPLTYAWTQDAGKSVAVNGAATDTVSFTVPDGSAAEGAITLTVTVQDGRGGAASDSATVQLYLGGDVTHDGFVNVGDLQALITNWSLEGSDLAADLNADGTVNVNDLQLLAANWGSSLK